MSNLNGKLLSSALRYAELGYAVFPCIPGSKKPLTEHGFKDAATDPEQIEAWWREHPQANIGIPTAGLLVVDVDGSDNPWPEDEDRLQDLSAGPTSQTPRGGRHHIFRQPEGRIWKNTSSRLATKVDTRADGGYVVVPPSIVDGKPYEWALNLDTGPESLPEPPEWLLVALDDTDNSLWHQKPQNGNGTPSLPLPGSVETPSPTSDGNVIPTGQRNSTLARLAGAMRRVGMGKDEIQAALLKTSASRCKPPLANNEVERIARSICRYDPDQITVAMAENHWGQFVACGDEAEESDPGLPDPGPLPDELMRVPGFVSEVMDYCLETAPYPNQVMAFCGALALQAFLAGRKVRDPGDNRTNIYLLGLAHSAAGKDWPRKVNTRIAHGIGLSGSLGDRFASGEGIQDALFLNPCMLFQTDEIDGMLQSINKAKDARHESIMGTLLTMYSASNSVFPVRRKAGKESPGAIDQPCLVIFGTAIPNHYYEALSERMLTNGFFARMLILESGKRSKGQEPSIRDIPERAFSTAKWWSEFRSSAGNLEVWHPVPAIVDHTEGARERLVEARVEAESEYASAEERGDAVGTTVWGRGSEHTRKLALLYAISANHETPRIDKSAAEWSTRFVMHQTRRMLYMAKCHVADNPFHADCLKVLQRLREAHDHSMAHSQLLRRMKVDTQTLHKIVQTLVQQGEIEVAEVKTSGRTGFNYRLVRG